MYWRVALLILLTTSVPQAKAEPPDEEALRLLNHSRHPAGLTSVKLDRQTQRWGAWSTQITWCRTKAPTQWPGSIPIPSGRTRPARAPWVRHVLAFACDQAAPALSIIAFLEMLARALLILGAVSCREMVRRSACAAAA
jgi:hypothetical protein